MESGAGAEWLHEEALDSCVISIVGPAASALPEGCRSRELLGEGEAAETCCLWKVSLLAVSICSLPIVHLLSAAVRGSPGRENKREP